MTRTRRSARNAAVAVAVTIVGIACAVVTQRLLLDTLGPDVTGLNALFTSIVAFLSMAELGIGAAIVYRLYAPLAHQDWQRVRTFIAFYQRCYRLIAVAVCVIAVVLLPFLAAVGADGGDAGVDGRIVLGLFVADVVASYFFAHRRSLLIAGEANHVVSGVRAVYLSGLLVAQVLVLWQTENFYLFLAVKVVIRTAEGLVLELLARRRFPRVRSLGGADPLDRADKAEMFRAVKGLVYHKVGSYAVLGTDAIIISTALSLTSVARFSNYALLQAAILTLGSQAFSAVTASVGNLLASTDRDRWIEVQGRAEALSFWLATAAAAGFLACSAAIVTLWLGTRWVFDDETTLLFAACIFLALTRPGLGVFKDAAGIFHPDRYIPLAESLVNLVVGIILVQLIGIPGVLIATVASSLVLHLFSLPRYVYVAHLGGTYRSYFGNLLVRYVQMSICLLLVLAVRSWDEVAESLALSFLAAVVVVGGMYALSSWIRQRDRDLVSMLAGVVHA